MTSKPLFSTVTARLKIGCQRPHVRPHQATLTPRIRTFAGDSTNRLNGSDSGPSARRGRILDTVTASAACPGRVEEVARFKPRRHGSPRTGGQRNTNPEELV